MHLKIILELRFKFGVGGDDKMNRVHGYLMIISNKEEVTKSMKEELLNLIKKKHIVRVNLPYPLEERVNIM